MMAAQHLVRKSLRHVFIVLILILNVLPLVIALSSSFRSIRNMTNPLNLFSEFTMESYHAAFSRMQFPIALMNSLVMTVVAVSVVVLITSMAAYPIARIDSKFSKFLYIFFLSGLVIPSQMIIIPIVKTMQGLDISNTQLRPVIMFITCSIPFSSFLYTGFIKSSVPAEIEESALIDGAGVFRRFWQIVFPLLIPVTTAVIITQGVWIWNDFFYPMVFISKQVEFPLPLAMLGFLGDQTNPTAWNVLFAASILTSLPLLIIFAFLQKFFIAGLTIGAVKG